jgi:hypothetical protein
MVQTCDAIETFALTTPPTPRRSTKPIAPPRVQPAIDEVPSGRPARPERPPTPGVSA